MPAVLSALINWRHPVAKQPSSDEAVSGHVSPLPHHPNTILKPVCMKCAFRPGPNKAGIRADVPSFRRLACTGMLHRQVYLANSTFNFADDFTDLVDVSL